MSRPIHEVKPLQARLVRSWETRLEVRVLSVPGDAAAELAQSVERKALNLVVVGSSPTFGVASFSVPHVFTGTRMRGAMAARRIPDPKVAGSIPVVFTIRCSIVASTFRCGRKIPGSIPGGGTR